MISKLDEVVGVKRFVSNKWANLQYAAMFYTNTSVHSSSK